MGRKTLKTIVGLGVFVFVVGGIISGVKKIKEYKFKKSLAPNAIHEEMFKEFKDIDGDGYLESVISFGENEEPYYEIRWDKYGRPEIIYPTKE